MRMMPVWFLPLLAWALSPGLPGYAQEAGEAIYARQCASCHGKQGEGTKRHSKPLAGARSLPQLTRLVLETMPEGKPGSLSEAEARDVSTHVFDRYYSPAAQERNAPPRIAVTRLTAPQYRNAVADVVASFRGYPGWGPGRGLKGEYFKGRNYNRADRVLERVDPVVDFDWGVETPAEGIDAKQFSTRHNGSLRPPATGEYQFIVRTEHATRLFVNDMKTPVVDAWVKSGADKEYSGSIFLVAGRIYPLRLEMSKAKQGVDDTAKEKKKPTLPAMLHLEWVPPRGERQVVPDRCLAPNGSPAQLIVSTPFPPDDRSLGWERGSSISKGWHQAVTQASVEAAGWVREHLDELAGTKVDAPDRQLKARGFCKSFAERAWRRPLLEVEEKFLLDTVLVAAPEPGIGAQKVVLAVLQSPAFLYQRVGNTTGPRAVAERLAWTLWDSVPDPELSRAAAEGRLGTPAQIAAQAGRMINDPRGHAKMMGFFRHWLRLDQATDIAKDAARFPGFDRALVADLRESLERQVEEVALGDRPDYRRLLTGDEVYLNDRLAAFYGTALPAEAGFRRLPLNPAERAGVLTHPYLLASLAYNQETSPIHRGVFLARSLLGVAMRPPPEAVSPLAPDLHPSLSTRERVTLQTQATACISCHGIINPLGFSLEGFDAVGRIRVLDRARPVDCQGAYLARDGVEKKFKGARQLATFLAESPEAHDAFIQQLFHHLVQQPERAFGTGVPDELRQGLVADQYDIRKLAVRVATRTATINSQVASKTDPNPRKSP